MRPKERPSSAQLQPQLAALKLLILDVDGTLTDGYIALDETDNHIKRFSIKDGMAIRSLIRETPLQVGIISHSTHAIAIQRRAAALEITRCYVGNTPKLEVLQVWLKELNITLSHTAVIGDDTNDMDLFNACGHGACPADASPNIKAVADVVLGMPGGEGCVREWIQDYYLQAKYWDRR